MSREVIVSNGLDPLTKPIVEYLDQQYGIPARMIKRVQLDSEVGRLQTLTVTLLVEEASPIDLGPESPTDELAREWSEGK